MAELQPVTVVGQAPTSFKVFIKGPGGKVTFQASAPLTESRTAGYDQYSIVHLPTSIFAYRATSSRKYQITAKLVSRNLEEAEANARYLDLIRAWVLPDFGGTGATPPILKLTAYNNDNIKNLQCVMISYSFSFPDDVDYIFSTDTSKPPMPVIGVLSIDLEEAYSAEQIANRDWKIKNDLEGSFGDAESTDNKKVLGSDFQLTSASTFPGIASLNAVAAKAASSATNATSLLGKLGTIGGAIAGKKLLGNNAGAVLGSLVGGKLGNAISSSPILKDNFNLSSALNSNVFTTGVSQATVASQTSQQQAAQQAFRKSEIAEQNAFGRDANPAPPDLADFYG